MNDRHWSLRGRLMRRVLAVVALGWLATIGLSAVVLNHEMNEMFDEELQALAQTTVLFLDASGQEAIPREVGIETNDGERVLRILSTQTEEPPGPWPPLQADGFARADGWRILRLTAEDMVIEVAHSDAWRREETLETAAAFLVFALPLLGLVAFALRSGLSGALAPVDGLRRRMEDRRPDDLSPLSAKELPRELAPLVAGLNGYIGRVESLRQAERQFVANAAHELRTPLAAIRLKLDLSDDAGAKAAVPMLDALTRRVERLLQLARSEAGIGLQGGTSDLVLILRLLVEDARRTEGAVIRFDDGDLSRLVVALDADAVSILVRNALENAVEHGSGPVLVRLTSAAEVTITNPTSATEMPDRPFRKGRESNGMGLGLSIMTALSSAMDVGFEAGIHDGVATVRLSFRSAIAG